MFCGKCGTEQNDSARFCKRCGAPVVNRNSRENGLSDNSNRDKAESYKKKNGIITILLIACVIAVCVIIVILKFSVFTGGSSEDDKLHEKGKTDSAVIEELNEPVDAKEFYEEFGTIISSEKVTESKEVQSEKDAYTFFEQHGFGNVELDYDFDMNGEIDEPAYDETDEEEEVAVYSEAKHPEYTTYYATQSGEIWALILINGSLYANPLSYNSKSDRDVQVMLSESGTITGYDCVTSTFFEVKPKLEYMKLIVVDSIDAATLESMTKEEIDKL